MTDNTRSTDSSFSDAFTEAFLSLHAGLPRQSPGSEATSRRLLSLCGDLPERPRVLDLGCGPGHGALFLAAEAGAEVTAVDLNEGFLDELRASADERGLSGRIHPVRADIGDLPFPDGSFDLVWAEGSAYLIGFDRALAEWRRLLAPGGALVLTECEWTADEPSAGARAFWDANASLRSRARNLAAAQAAGWRVLDTHLLPDTDWDEYYGPLGVRAERTAAAHAADPTGVPEGARAALASTFEEIEVRSRHGHEYGYTGYVLRPVTAGTATDPRTARWTVSAETPADRAGVYAVNLAAFDTPLEADLVDALRADADAWVPGLSIVARDGSDGDRVVAHALLTRGTVGGSPVLTLAPVATDPGLQRSGAGGAVIAAALAEARRRGESLVTVLGHPDYYPRFGFLPASRFGIAAPFEVPDEAIMVLVLDPEAALPTGTIGYPAPFGV
ncbi:bifunctional class I SAM-dependent methyltransferase/N-acetyltransferase [Streptomyces sp. BI20]|uniref:bifunctional class I SAM-dependent methyltransferase/N-acetyltransferase n=1 Tax=Streptomyces sp. BI20 TaxID=3403460 RepID=UPI003C76777E